MTRGYTIVIVMLFDMIIDMIVDDYWYSLTIDDQKVIAVGIFCVNSQCQLPPSFAHKTLFESTIFAAENCLKCQIVMLTIALTSSETWILANLLISQFQFELAIKNTPILSHISWLLGFLAMDDDHHFPHQFQFALPFGGVLKEGYIATDHPSH